MTASWRPALWVSCAFNADPNDPSIIPAWSDLSSPFFIGADGIQRGRQYELDQNQTSQPSFSFLDQSEYLNPANVSSPYYPNVVPLRQLLMQAMWPNTGSGNLMNASQPASSILGTTSAGYDPSFESYTAGSSVPWIDAIGGTAPVVGTTTPHTGSHDLTYTVASASAEQGVKWTVPAVLGQQYTASVYVRQSSASTQVIGVGGLTMAQDAFNRTTSNGWGSADIGGAWTTTGGSASDFSVLPGLANIEGTSVNVVRTVTVGTAAADTDTIAYFQLDQVPTGASIRPAVIGRRTASNTFYLAVAVIGTDSSILFSINRLVAGSEAVNTSVTMPFPFQPDTLYGLRLKIVGTSLSASMWQATDTMPTTFTLTGTDTTITGAGTVGCYQRLTTSNSNVNPNTTFSTFSALATVAGSSTSTTGAYVRLTATFTASQPTHTIQVATSGTAVAGTVLVDDPQYEQGASAGTFTTTGPTIYGVFRGFVERWPSEWLNAGFLGLCQATAVDAFEALNLYTLNSEYYQQVLALSPFYYWPLNDASGSTTYGEQSGNNGPPLVNVSSKYGPGTPPAAGNPINISGDPGGTGVTITPTSSAGFAQPGTIPMTGFGAGQGAVFSYPLTSSASWGASAAAWVTATPGPSSDDRVIVGTIPRGSTTVQPVYLSVDDVDMQLEVTYEGSVGLGGIFASGGPSILDGLPHLVVGTVTQVNGGNTTVTAFVDGVQVGTQAASTASLGGMATPSQTLAVGGLFFTGNGSLPPEYWHVLNGTLAHVALWDRALSQAEITALWDAGGLGNAGETSGARVARYVASTWSGLTDIDTGSSIMGISTVTTGTAVLQACQDVTVSEQGNFWADKDGQIVFAGRQRRYLDITSLYTLGEDGAGGELPYEDDLAYDFDPTFIFGTVTVNNADGVTVNVGNLQSQRSYFPRSNTTATNLLSDQDAIQAGYWLLNTHDQPTQRVAVITLDPMGNPDLWAAILTLEIGDRVTINRRPSAANGGSGFEMSGDFFVENIAHGGIDMSVQNARWTTTLLCSPAQETSNVFIFNDPTYGTFDGAFSRFAL